MLKKFKGHVVAVAAATSMVAAPAFAAASFDTASIITDIGVYAAAAVLLVTTMIAARWGLKALGLLRR